jgi:hypothetical protein
MKSLISSWPNVCSVRPLRTLRMPYLPTQTAARLAPLLDRISEALGPEAHELETFERWALLVTESLLAAGRDSRSALLEELQRSRAALLELCTGEFLGFSATGRIELMRSCRREWLTTLLELVESFVEEPQGSVIVNLRLAA